MKQFKSAAQAQRFLSAHDQINNLFHLPAITSLSQSIELSGPKNSRSGPKSVGWVGNKPQCLLPVACIQLTRPCKLTVPSPRFVLTRHLNGYSGDLASGTVQPLTNFVAAYVNAAEQSASEAW